MMAHSIPPALILAGGFGTRLKSVVPDLPKPLADIDGKPFLWWLLSQLEDEGVKDVYLSVGYMHDHIQSFFGETFNSHIKLHYIIETQPLGTGGAILNACNRIPHQQILILNGDTLAMVNLGDLVKYSIDQPSSLLMAVAVVEDATRYGTVIVNPDKKITGFAEKGKSGKGSINAGIYLLNKSLFAGYNLGEKFSFESDFLAKHINTINLLAYDQVTDFIDIGIPKDYQLAQHKIPAMVNAK